MDLQQAFRLQATACRTLGSPLYETLLETCAIDLFEGGPVAEVVPGWDGDPVDDAVALRLMGGLHRLVLTGAAPALAYHYPTMGGTPDLTRCGADLLTTVAANLTDLRAGMLRPPQTNEVGRSAVLIGGLLEIDRMVALPIRLCEIGSSAGLNLLMDRYRYELGVGTWGDATADTVITSAWTGSVPDIDRSPQIVERSGCDRTPLDLTDPRDRVSLLSYVWADQVARFDRLRSAVDVALVNRPAVAAASGDDWLPGQLERRHPGTVTVVMHSVVMQYVDAHVRLRILDAVRNAGRRATPDGPVAWLRFEPGLHGFELRLAMWPLGIDVLLANSHPHGTDAEWFVGREPT